MVANDSQSLESADCVIFGGFGETEVDTSGGVWYAGCLPERFMAYASARISERNNRCEEYS